MLATNSPGRICVELDEKSNEFVWLDVSTMRMSVRTRSPVLATTVPVGGFVGSCVPAMKPNIAAAVAKATATCRVTRRPCGGNAFRETMLAVDAELGSSPSDAPNILSFSSADGFRHGRLRILRSKSSLMMFTHFVSQCFDSTSIPSGDRAHRAILQFGYFPKGQAGNKMLQHDLALIGRQRA